MGTVGTNIKCSMLKSLKAMLLGLVIASAGPVHAGNDFFFEVYGGSTNMWSNCFLSLPTSIANALLYESILDDDEVGGSLWARWDIFQIKMDGEKVKQDGNFWQNKYGFKARDMFRNFQYGLRFGWQPELSPFGVYVSCAYQHRHFKALFDDSGDWSKYNLNYVRPGVGIRITPLINLLDEEGWSPIVEIGTAYNYNFSCSAPYDDTKDQFNNGITTTFGLGARFEDWSLSAGVELDNYSLFNKDFTPDKGITYPYKDVKTNHTTIYLSLSRNF